MSSPRYFGAHTRLLPGAVEEYERLHAQIWPELAMAMRHSGIRQYVIYRDELDLFHHIESDDIERAFTLLAPLEIEQQWQKRISALLDPEVGDGSFLPIVFNLNGDHSRRPCATNEQEKQ